MARTIVMIFAALGFAGIPAVPKPSKPVDLSLTDLQGGKVRSHTPPRGFVSHLEK